MIFTLLILFSIQMTPEQVVQKQLDTYNSRDIDGFMSVMSEKVVLINFSDDSILAEGFNEVKSAYQNLFDQSPELNSNLLNRMVLGNKVIDHERITGRMGNPDPIELIVIYEVEGDKISKITVLRK